MSEKDLAFIGRTYISSRHFRSMSRLWFQNIAVNYREPCGWIRLKYRKHRVFPRNTVYSPGIVKKMTPLHLFQYTLAVLVSIPIALFIAFLLFTLALWITDKLKL